jgi:superoxide dismutase, Fe-Mn family
VRGPSGNPPIEESTMLNRRETLGVLGIGGVLASDLGRGMAQGSSPQGAASPQETIPALAGQHPIQALPFDPKSLRGLSEKLILSHHENNYAGAVKNLNKVEQALAQLTKDTPGYVVNGLKERQLTYSNSAALHELYFGNLGGDGKASGEVAAALAKSYGTFARWEEEFRATGSSLGGGSGWVLLELELPSKALRTYWSGNHSQARAGSLPLLVLDMYEHAYQMDHGAAAAKYIDVFFDNLRWEEVERRFARAAKAADVLRGG